MVSKKNAGTSVAAIRRRPALQFLLEISKPNSQGGLGKTSTLRCVPSPPWHSACSFRLRPRFHTRKSASFCATGVNFALFRLCMKDRMQYLWGVGNRADSFRPSGEMAGVLRGRQFKPGGGIDSAWAAAFPVSPSCFCLPRFRFPCFFTSYRSLACGCVSPPRSVLSRQRRIVTVGIARCCA